MPLLNRLKLLNNYLKQKPYVTHGPVEVGIEITNRCNLNCIMCNRQEMNRPIGDMSWDLFTHLVDQTCATAGIYFICGLGEQLLHPQVFEMIDYCHSKKVPVGLSTNATVMDKQKVESLLEHPPDYFIMALDALTPETYAKIRVGGDFEAAVENSEWYLKRYNETRPPTLAMVQFVKQELNQTELVGFEKYWKSKGARFVRVKPVVPMIGLNPEEYSSSRRCLNPWRTLNFDWQGGVYPCACAMGSKNGDLGLGNIKGKQLEEVWNSREWQELRQSFPSNKISPLCRACRMRQPTIPITIVMSFFPTITTVKITPYFEKLEQKLGMFKFWRW